VNRNGLVKVYSIPGTDPITNRLTGSFILIEQGTNATVAAGMLSAPTEAVTPEYTDFAI
jgi:sulfate adenylyltransferase subunit 1 (EFTu-like GTPase family)